MATPFQVLKAVFSDAEVEGVLFLYGSRRRWSWAELDTSSLEGLDIFYVHIT